jgi:hypothetical protein
MITRVSLDLMAVKYGVANERSSAVITRVKASPQFSSRQPWPGLSSYGSSALTAPQHPGYRISSDLGACADGGKDGDMAEVPGGRVFISYRREDAGYPAGWLFDQLAARLGADRVFKDVDSIEPGDDFAEMITAAVASCTVLLAVIGDRWLTAAGQDGRRLDDPGDFVRLEIEAALARGVRVVPVLVGGVPMPRPEQLPASLAALARRQAVELSHARFSSDLAGLLKVLDKILGPASSRQPQPSRAPAQGGQAGKGRAAPQDATAALPASVTLFRDDDGGFRGWRENHPDGFFLNTERNPGPGYLMLHRSGCPHFTRSPLHWTKDYVKFCSPDRGSLEAWAKTMGDLRYCRTCFR